MTNGKKIEQEFNEILMELSSDGKLNQMKAFIQHGKVTTYDHVIDVARASFLVHRGLRKKSDPRALVRAALLHDYFLYDWHNHKPNSEIEAKLKPGTETEGKSESESETLRIYISAPNSQNAQDSKGRGSEARGSKERGYMARGSKAQDSRAQGAKSRGSKVKITQRLHGFTHAHEAAENARRDFSVSDEERAIIESHMWPLNITRIPKSGDAWIVCIVDKICSARETLFRRK